MGVRFLVSDLPLYRKPRVRISVRHRHGEETSGSNFPGETTLRRNSRGEMTWAECGRAVFRSTWASPSALWRRKRFLSCDAGCESHPATQPHIIHIVPSCRQGLRFLCGFRICSAMVRVPHLPLLHTLYTTCRPANYHSGHVHVTTSPLAMPGATATLPPSQTCCALCGAGIAPR